MKGVKTFLGFQNPGTVVVTGASSGIGESFAYAFAKHGFDLVLVARRTERLMKIAEKLKSEYFISCNIISADLSVKEDIEKVAAYIRQIENLDILVNDAGFGTSGDFLHVPITRSLQMLNVHVIASVQLTHSALQVFINRKRGAIINVSSLGAYILARGCAMYTSTKSFLVTFSENLGIELKNRNIFIQALCPGFTLTEFHEVGNLQNFDRNKIPSFMWMNPEYVVSRSLKALEKHKKIVCVPGLKYKISRWLIINFPFIRKSIKGKVKC